MSIITIKACLFDLDGVIVDTAKYHYLAWKRLANQLGFDFSEHQNEELKGVSRMKSLELILEWGGVSLPDSEKERWATLKNEWYLELVSEMTPAEVLPGVLDFLTQLKAQNIKIALGSVSKNAKLILQKIELLNWFDAIIDGTNLTHGKPDPQVFLLGAQALNVLPHECVVFEDAVAGIESATRAGMKSVGIGSAQVLTQASIVLPGFETLQWTALASMLNKVE